jgi:hypothetical protein
MALHANLKLEGETAAFCLQGDILKHSIADAEELAQLGLLLRKWEQHARNYLGSDSSISASWRSAAMAA